MDALTPQALMGVRRFVRLSHVLRQESHKVRLNAAQCLMAILCAFAAGEALFLEAGVLAIAAHRCLEDVPLLARA